jgi:hypothetical protein
MRNNSIELITNIYRELYKNSTPSADFDELVKNATTNELGQLEIPSMDYEISEEIFNEIVETNLKQNRLSKWYKNGIRNTIMLGCSPKFKK